MYIKIFETRTLTGNDPGGCYQSSLSNDVYLNKNKEVDEEKIEKDYLQKLKNHVEIS